MRWQKNYLRVIKILEVFPEKNQIILDVHRPENFNYKHRLVNIVEFTKWISAIYRLPVKMLEFGRTKNKIEEYGIDLGGYRGSSLECPIQTICQQFIIHNL